MTRSVSDSCAAALRFSTRGEDVRELCRYDDCARYPIHTRCRGTVLNTAKNKESESLQRTPWRNNVFVMMEIDE